MTDTPRSLLQRLRENPDEESWKRLVDLYTPLLVRWLRQARVDGSDADDVVQEIFVAVVREMSSFQHNQQRGAFRCWLRNILINRLREHWHAKRAALAGALSFVALLQQSDSLVLEGASPAVAPSQALGGVPGYTLLERLGQGGMGVVWKARQVGLNRLVPPQVLILG